MSEPQAGPDRRALIGLPLAALAGAAPAHADAPDGKGPGQEKETPAVEDLMREHGVLRRALLVYAEVAPRLRASPARFDAKPLNQAAQLFRTFGEDYHEKKLEEAHIFPVVAKTPGAAAGYVGVLTAQHARGREVTGYILQATRSGTVSAGDADALAKTLTSFVLMYQNHAAREDTVVFPAWKLALSARRIEELGDRFEDIERQQFGHDGYEDAVRRIAQVEAAYGLTDIAQFTAPPAPRLA